MTPEEIEAAYEKRRDNARDVAIHWLGDAIDFADEVLEVAPFAQTSRIPAEAVTLVRQARAHLHQARDLIQTTGQEVAT